MKDLDLNPQQFDIQLSTYNDAKADGYAEVNYRFGAESKQESHAFGSEEARKVGEWFLQLSKRLAKYEES